MAARVVRAPTRLTSALLIALFAAMTSATCLAGAWATRAEQDCCLQMAGRCGAGMTQDPGCCPKAPTFQDQIAAKERVSIIAPTITELALIELPAYAAALPAFSIPPAPSASPPGARGIPSYILLSVLRV